MINSDKHVDILVLDDDVDLLTSTAELLADTGYRVKGFADPESALEFSMDQTFSVGLFDFRLGSVKNGLDVVETMQALGNKSVYVMVSADVETSTQVRAANLKLFEFMRKPVAPEALLETVERAMAQAHKLAA
jgi:two-component system phosphoglycerate transport system response regulator PgtA